MAEEKRSRLRFPNFKLRAVTLSYDDGQIHDEKMLEIISKYGIKCTFNICSGCYGNAEHYNNLPKEKAIELYNKYGVEVAVHGKNHLALTEVSKGVALKDVIECREDLENDFGRIIRGFAYAYGVYNDDVIDILKTCGIVYARTVGGTENFVLPLDWLRWQGTCHHQNPKLMELVDEFLSEPKTNYFWHTYPRLFYLWGHSYEFNNNNNWDLLEEFCKKVGNRKDIWCATNMEIYDYVTAFDNLVYSANGKIIYNPSNIDVFVCINGQNIMIPKNQSVEI